MPCIVIFHLKHQALRSLPSDATSRAYRHHAGQRRQSPSILAHRSWIDACLFGQTLPVAWTYEHPLPEAAAAAGLVSFLHEDVTTALERLKHTARSGLDDPRWRQTSGAMA